MDVWLDCATSECEQYAGADGTSIFEVIGFVPNDDPAYNYSLVPSYGNVSDLATPAVGERTPHARWAM